MCRMIAFGFRIAVKAFRRHSVKKEVTLRHFVHSFRQNAAHKMTERNAIPNVIHKKNKKRMENCLRMAQPKCKLCVHFYSREMEIGIEA